MIAVDDTASMRAGHQRKLGADGMAMEALALICNALTRLEVGEVAVSSFGDECKLLHPFDQPFTADSGAAVVSNFAFKTDRLASNHMVNTVDWLCQTMALAKEQAGGGAAAADQVQLCFLVSDGVLQADAKSLERIKKLTREASTRDCMFVYLLLDTGDDSIMEKRRPKYEKGKLIGLEYLIEGFPFDYYVCCKDIANLPEVLGDSLRQWIDLLKDK